MVVVSSETPSPVAFRFPGRAALGPGTAAPAGPPAGGASGAKPRKSGGSTARSRCGVLLAALKILTGKTPRRQRPPNTSEPPNQEPLPCVSPVGPEPRDQVGIRSHLRPSAHTDLSYPHSRGSHDVTGSSKLPTPRQARCPPHRPPTTPPYHPTALHIPYSAQYAP